MGARKIDTTLRRWCETCQRFTRSKMAYAPGGGQVEVCAEHTEPDEEW